MDKDTLRKQLYDEIHSQFETRLREARRQKAELEEQIEVSEDKWRNERRRLNAEIDRLELVVADSREARRKGPAAKSQGIDPQELEKLQAAAEEKLRQAEQAWASERAQLKSEVSRLQNGIADMIERSNNPLRANQGEKDRLESKLQDALRAKRQAEDALLQAKNEWDQEKVRLVGDVVKIRRSGTAAKISTSKPDDRDDPRIEQLERQLDEAIKSRDKQLREASAAMEKLERELEKARQAKPPVAKEGPSENVAALKAELEEARAQATLALRRVEDERAAADKQRTNLELQLRQAISAKNNLEQELEKARQEILSQRTESGDSASPEVVEQLRQAISAKDSLEQELEQARQEILRQGTESGDSVSSEVVEQLRQQYDERMQDMIRQKTQLSDELRSITSLLEEERDKLGANGTGSQEPSTMDSGAIDAEVSRIQDLIAGIAKLIDNPETELSTVIRKNVERAELDAYLRGILYSLGRGPGL
jgi:DNA repair exonuclease SbcCD ATPase subunit